MNGEKKFTNSNDSYKLAQMWARRFNGPMLRQYEQVCYENNNNNNTTQQQQQQQQRALLRLIKHMTIENPEQLRAISFEKIKAALNC